MEDGGPKIATTADRTSPTGVLWAIVSVPIGVIAAPVVSLPGVFIILEIPLSETMLFFAQTVT